MDKVRRIGLAIQQLISMQMKLTDPNYNKSEEDADENDLKHLEERILSQMTNNETSALQSTLRQHDFSSDSMPLAM